MALPITASRDGRMPDDHPHHHHRYLLNSNYYMLSITYSPRRVIYRYNRRYTH